MKKNNIKIKLVKIKEVEDALHPNNIKEGYEKIGYMQNEPRIGECFWVYTISSYFHTSTIQEIIDKDTFKTLNSIYKIIRL